MDDKRARTESDLSEAGSFDELLKRDLKTMAEREVLLKPKDER